MVQLTHNFQLQREFNSRNLVLCHVLVNLFNRNWRSSPFTLHDVEGIFVLDSAPDYTEVERTFLQCLAVQRPLHQLCVPGSFRLGHHGSYLLDGDWEYVTQESLPSWVPLHDIWQSSTPDSWRSPLSVSRETSYHRITVHRRNHCIDAAFEVLHAYRQFLQ